LAIALAGAVVLIVAAIIESTALAGAGGVAIGYGLGVQKTMHTILDELRRGR
jgi:hypothetical protein